MVEVAASSIRYDRARKGPVYARAGIQEYWIVNLFDRTVEVYRDPSADGGYRIRLVFGEGDRLSPLATPSATILVRDLLP